MSETMTLAELEHEIKEARLRGAEDHTQVWVTAEQFWVQTVVFDGVLTIK